MGKPRNTHLDTLSLHAGARPDPATGARATPIYQSASFVFHDSDHAAALFDMARPGHVYSRISNPTCAVLEERIAALEGGVGAIATASGQAALHLAIVTLLSARLAHRRLARALRRLAQPARLHAAALRHRDDVRRCARLDALARGDPTGDAAALRRDARQSRARRARHPARRGTRARARVAAARRFDVHDAVPDAAVRAWRGSRLPFGDQVPVRARHRDRRAARRFGAIRLERNGCARQVSDADRALSRLPRHGVHRRIDDRARSCCARGARASATSARAWRRSPRSRSCRGSRRCRCGWRVTSRTRARSSRSSQRIRWSRPSAIPSSTTHPDHALAQKLLPRGCGAVFSFELRGTRAQGRKFIESLRSFRILPTSATRNRSSSTRRRTTHFRMSADELAKAGIAEGTIRLSIGLEHTDDLIEDLSRALYAAGKAA